MVTLLLTALFVQQRSAIVLWHVLFVVIGAAASLYFALILHMFPESAIVASTIHLAIVLSGAPIIARTLVRQNQERGAL